IIQGTPAEKDWAAAGSMPSFCAIASMSSFSTTKFQNMSHPFITTPASRPPITTRPVLMDVIGCPPSCEGRHGASVLFEFGRILPRNEWGDSKPSATKPGHALGRRNKVRCWYETMAELGFAVGSRRLLGSHW